MICFDQIYGSIEVSEPVLLDLIKSNAIQRLHGVLQHGISGLIGLTRKTSRYEHSLGVMHLVRMFGGGLEEQIAALLHDVSHTAFSHVIDYVFGLYDTQGYHEDQKYDYISKTDIPYILKEHDYDWVNFFHTSKFPLLEQDLPKLCADRLDYFLRDARDLGLATDDDISECLNNLNTSCGRFAVINIDVARWLGYTFIQADKKSWANFKEVGLYELAAKVIRRGLEIGVITDDDIWGKDQSVWDKLCASPDQQIQQDIRLVDKHTNFEENKENPDFIISTKLRSVDPEVLQDGQLIPISELDDEFNQYRQKYLKENSGMLSMRVVVNN